MFWSADRCRRAIEHREQHQVENRTAPGCAFLFTSASYIALNCATVTTGLWQSRARSILRAIETTGGNPLTSVPPILARAASQHRTLGTGVVTLALGTYQLPRHRRHVDGGNGVIRWRTHYNSYLLVYGVEDSGRRWSMGYSEMDGCV